MYCQHLLFGSLAFSLSFRKYLLDIVTHSLKQNHERGMQLQSDHILKSQKRFGDDKETGE